MTKVADLRRLPHATHHRRLLQLKTRHPHLRLVKYFLANVKVGSFLGMFLPYGRGALYFRCRFRNL